MGKELHLWSLRMKLINTKLLVILIFYFSVVLNLLLVQTSFANEPIVVLNYSHSRDNSADLNSNNQFISNPSYSAKHKVQINETLGHILFNYYGKSGLNLRIVEMAIVEYNPRAFRDRNPNFLFAEKTIYLPSLNEIKDLVLGQNRSKVIENSNNSTSQIYFFGG